MDEDLAWRYRRWRAAEEEEADAAADAACRALFEELTSDVPVSSAFTARTMAAVEATVRRDQVLARRTRRAGVVGGLFVAGGIAYFAGGSALWLLSKIFTGGLDLLIRVIVSTAGGVQAGADVWTVLAGIGRTVTSLAADPTVTIAMLVLQGIAISALFAVQRLLGSDRESVK